MHGLHGLSIDGALHRGHLACDDETVSHLIASYPASGDNDANHKSQITNLPPRNDIPAVNHFHSSLEALAKHSTDCPVCPVVDSFLSVR